MSQYRPPEGGVSNNLVVLFSASSEKTYNKLFLAALEWGTARYRRTHYVRRQRFARIPTVPPQCLSDPSRLKTIRFYYADDRPLEKASSLSVDYRVRHNESLIIVETDEESSMERHALANTLALLASFATQKRRSLVSLPQDDDLMTLASLFTRHLYNLDDEGRLLKVTR